MGGDEGEGREEVKVRRDGEEVKVRRGREEVTVRRDGEEVKGRRLR